MLWQKRAVAKAVHLSQRCIDLTATIYVWCIEGDISTFPVGDATTTMTPDGDAVYSHFRVADTTLLICSHRLRDCWSRESSARPANEASSTLLVSSKAGASSVVWLAAAETGDGGDVTSDCLSASTAHWPGIYLDVARPQEERSEVQGGMCIFGY